MPWYNPYNYQGYRNNLLPESYFYKTVTNDKGVTETVPIEYGSKDWENASSEFMADLEGGDESEIAWNEFVQYLSNAMIPYMSGNTARSTASTLGWGHQTDPGYTQSYDQLNAWDDNSSMAGRAHDRTFESSDRWGAINQGLTEALKYLMGGKDYRSGTGDDPWTTSMNWLSSGIGMGQDTGLQGTQNYRNRAQEARRQQQYGQHMSNTSGVNEGIQNLFENLWGYDARTGPISRQGYSGTNIYRYSPSGSGASGFYSYGNSRYR